LHFFPSLASFRGHDPLDFRVARPPDAINARDARRLTPLHFAAAGKIEVVEFLITHHADVNARDRAGNTPLHATLDIGAGESGGSFEADEMLDAAKADLRVKNNAGQTALALAREKKCARIARLLEDAGGTE